MRAAVLCVTLGLAAALRPVHDYRNLWFKKPGSPGMRIRLTEAGLTRLRSLMVEALSSEFGKLVLPSYNVPAGQFTVILNNLRVTRFTAPQASSHSLRPPSDVQLVFEKMSADIAAGFVGGLGATRATGVLSGAIRDLTIRVTARGVSQPGGGVGTQMVGCDVSMAPTAFQVTAPGLIGILIKQRQKDIDGLIRGNVPKILCGFFRSIVNRGTSAFFASAAKDIPISLLAQQPDTAQLRFVQQLQDGLVLDNKPVGGFKVKPGYIETNHRGEMRYRDSPALGAFFPRPMADELKPSDKKMIYVTASDYVVSSLFYHAARHGRLDFDVTNDSVPRDAKHFFQSTCDVAALRKAHLAAEGSEKLASQNAHLRKFKETCLGELIPQLQLAHPDTPTKIHLAPHGAPHFRLSDDGRGMLDTDARLLLQVPDGSRNLTVLATRGFAASGLPLRVEGGRIVGGMELEELTLGLHRTSLPRMDDVTIRRLTPVVEALVRQELGRAAAAGLSLPEFNFFKLSDPELSFGDGFLRIGADLDFDVAKVKQAFTSAMAAGPIF